MREHVKALAILNIIHASLVITIGLMALLLFGGLSAILGHRHDVDEIVIPILGMVGGFVFLALTIIALPKLIAAIGLLGFRPWARILTIVISALGLWEVPVGTALGAYGLWVLTSAQGTALFQRNSG